MIDYPNCAVSIQLIPTHYEANESAEIDRVTQILDTLSKGIIDQRIGNISFALQKCKRKITDTIQAINRNHHMHIIFLFWVMMLQ